MALRLLTPPTVEPVTLVEAKAQCRVTSTDEDALITRLISACRKACEQELRRALISQVWVKTIDAFPTCRGAIRLDWPPILSVDAVQYKEATAGAFVTLSAAAYTADTQSEPGYLVPAYGYEWPCTWPDINAVTVTYSAGYGPAPSDIGDDVKQWILLHVEHYFENRGASIEPDRAGIVPLPFIAGLLDGSRMYG
jgi:uncharacterized phiE125 gp8 family phage protein